MIRFGSWALAAVILTVSASTDAAGEPFNEDNNNLEDHAIWVIEYENDLFVGEDRYYTNGIRLSRVGQVRTPPSWLARVARRFPGIDDADTLPYRLSINHNLYTPADIENPALPPDDRPYAGWFNIQFATGTLSKHGSDRVHVGLGLVGPWAQGEGVQKAIHSAIDSPEPVGWEHQIRNEATLQLGYDRFRRIFNTSSEEGAGFDATWLGGVALGNAHTHASLGAFLRAGYNLTPGYGPPRITPAVSGGSYFTPNRSTSWYFYTGIEGRRVFRNLFLEGNTFGGTEGVSREREVGEIFSGFVYSSGPFRMAYTHVWRSREFIRQKESTSYGALSFSLWW